MNAVQWLAAQRELATSYLYLAVGLGASAGFLLLLQAWLLARMLDAVLFEVADLGAVSHWMSLLLAVILLRALLAWGAARAAFAAAARVKTALRGWLLRRLQALGPSHLAGPRSGAVATLVSDGVEALDGYFSRYLPAIAIAALLPLSFLALIIPADWLSGLILLATAPLIPLCMVFIGSSAQRLNQRQWRTLTRMSGHFLDRIQGLTTLKLFGVSRREAQAVARIAEDYRRRTMAVLRVAFLSSLALEFFAMAGIAIVAVLAGFRLLWGEMDFRDAFFVLLLAPELYLPLRNLGTHYHARLEAVAAAESMLELSRTPVPSRSTGALPLRSLGPPHVVFDDVHYRYPNGRSALSGVSFELRPGERVALVGSSGAGKSTLLSVLLGFVQPQHGCVRIDGRSLIDLNPDQWRSALTWLPQRPHIFAASMRENICLGRPDADDQALSDAADFAGVDRLIEELPAGYETRLGEGGRALSGGEAQRIALARAYLSDAPLLLLDEPTSHLDRVSEIDLQRRIERLALGRTVLVVAHRLATARSAERIVVLDAGRVVQQGRHAQLAGADGPYRRMVNACALGA